MNTDEFKGINAAEIAEELRNAAQESITEEDIKMRGEQILRAKALDKLDVPWARYERYTLVKGRIDALYGRAVIEYEKPGSIRTSTSAGFKEGVKQAKKHIRGQAKSKVNYHRYFGIALDGFKIVFVRFKEERWQIRGPFEVNKSTMLRLLEVIRGLRRKPLKADTLTKDLGPKSAIAKTIIHTFYKKLEATNSPRVNTLFEDWRRVYSQVCGYHSEKIKGLEEVYDLKDGEPERLLFTIHTYYALIMKFLSAEIATLYGDSFLQSYVEKLDTAYLSGKMERLFEELKNLEEGGIFAKIGIRNFLEADYFGWYLDVWDEEIADSIVKIVRKLSDYEPATTELEPEGVRDLLKKLYQYLLPKKIRHDLGEYYTPDWLAELVLDEVRYDGSLDKRILEPVCGSGTFIVLIINRVKKYAEEKYIKPAEVLEKILRNVIGFDLNPLAVIAARTNYLVALGDLIRYRRGDIEIPVYLADTLFVERKTTLEGATYLLRTAVGDLSIPVGIVKKKLLGNTLALVEECVKNKYSQEDFKARLEREQKEINEQGQESGVLIRLFNTLSKLEEEDRNKIWIKILKNSFAPLLQGKFDYVVGNPPWINWENLPKNYRNASEALWNKYRLKARANAKQFALGKKKKDISKLFVYVCSDRYLHDKGTLGFLITQMVFKTPGADVFRSFRLSESKRLNVLKVHDMVRLKPFEGAANMTSVIILRKGKKTTYPLPYILWKKVKKGNLTSATLDKAYELCSQERLVAMPIDPNLPCSQWLTVPPQIQKDTLNKIRGASCYKAHAGVYTGGANGIYWVKILSKLPTGHLLVENLHDVGIQKLRDTKTTIEPDHVYTLIRTGDLEKWSSTPTHYVIIPHTKGTGWKAISEHKIKTHSPKTYNYLHRFTGTLLSRTAYNRLRKGHPFYIMIDIGKRSFAPFKVVWKRMGSKLAASVLSRSDDQYIGKKPLIPQETISFIPLENKSEAHYLCSILNSTCVNFLVKSFSQLYGKSFATPSILRHIKIPKYDARNEKHRELVQLSEKAHKLTANGAKGDLLKVEDKIDNLLAQLYDLTAEELAKIKTAAKQLVKNP